MAEDEKNREIPREMKTRHSCEWRVHTGTQWRGCNYHFYRGCVFMSVVTKRSSNPVATLAITLLTATPPAQCEKEIQYSETR